MLMGKKGNTKGLWSHEPFFRRDLKYVLYQQVSIFFPAVSAGLTKGISSPFKSCLTYRGSLQHYHNTGDESLNKDPFLTALQQIHYCIKSAMPDKQQSNSVYCMFHHKQT